jgi:hypothetical protein
MIPANKIKSAVVRENLYNPDEKYIDVVTVDGFDFWFMGFLQKIIQISSACNLGAEMTLHLCNLSHTVYHVEMAYVHWTSRIEQSY